MTAGRDFQSCEEFDIFFFKEKVEYHGKQVCRVVFEKKMRIYFFFTIFLEKKSISREKTKTFFSLCEIVKRPMQLATQ